MKSPLRILHLEDDPADGELVQATLAADGLACDIVRVDTRGDFLAALGRGGFDLYLADYRLPAFDGVSALAFARDTCPDVPFIFVSGTIGEEQAIETLKRGATDYVLKHRLSRLAPVVRRVLREVEQQAERKRAEQRVRLLSTALESTANAVVITDREGAVTWVNPAFTHLTGYTAREILGKNLRLLKSDKHDEAFYQCLWTTIRSGQVWQGEMINRRKDGSLYTEEETITPVRGQGGEISHFIAIKQDITERKRGEATRHALYQASLQVQEPLSLHERLDRLLQAAHEVLQLDRVNILLAELQEQWLEAVATLGGEESLDVIRVPTGPEGGAVAEAYRTQQPVTWDGRAPVPPQLRLHPPYDQIRALRSRAFVVVPMIVQGRAIGVIAADRKSSRRPIEPATIELLQLFATQAALAIEQARLYERVAGEKARWETLCRMGTLLSRSLRLEEIFPAFAEAVRSLLPFDRICVVAPEGDRLVTLLSVAEPPLMDCKGLTWPQQKGTAVGWVLAHRQPRVAPDLSTEPTLADEKFIVQEGVRSSLWYPLVVGGETLGVLLLDSRAPGTYADRDLGLLGPLAEPLALALNNARLYAEAEQQAAELERRVAERTAELQDMNAELEAFTSSVSHDLRSPLRAMQGFAQALQEDYADKLDAEGRDYAQRIVAGARRMDALIRDLLAYSRLSRAELTREPVELWRVIAEARAHLEAELQAAELTVAEPLPTVLGHHGTLVQIVTNLLTNAVKFVPPGLVPQVRIWTETSPGWVRLWVQDNGIGIAPEHQGRIFRIFERLHGVEAYPGTGIGLAIVRKAVERLGGKVGVESAVGQGSRFWVEMPGSEGSV